MTDAAVEHAQRLLTSSAPEPRTFLKQPFTPSVTALPSELQIEESVEAWNNARENNLRYAILSKRPTLQRSSVTKFHQI